VNIRTFTLLCNKSGQLLQVLRGGNFFFFQPLIGALLGWLLLHEQLGTGFIFDSSLIACITSRSINLLSHLQTAMPLRGFLFLANARFGFK